MLNVLKKIILVWLSLSKLGLGLGLKMTFSAVDLGQGTVVN